jgi:hypothetical protein
MALAPYAHKLSLFYKKIHDVKYSKKMIDSHIHICLHSQDAPKTFVDAPGRRDQASLHLLGVNLFSDTLESVLEKVARCGFFYPATRYAPRSFVPS